MIEVQGGHNNWYTLRFNVGNSSDDVLFEMTFGENIAQPMSWNDAADYTAKCIAEKYENLYLGMSGGLDSEHVADILHRNNIKFTPIIGVLPAQVDHHYALRWCRLHNMEPVVIEFEFNDHRLLKIAKHMYQKIGAWTDGSIINTYLSDYVQTNGGAFLFADPTIGKRVFHKPIGEYMDVSWVQLASQLVYNNHNNPNGFMNYTPEIFLAQAQFLDITLDEVESRAKLYNLPFRAKICPALKMVSDEVIYQMIHLLKKNVNWIPDGCGWYQTDLIKKLTR